MASSDRPPEHVLLFQAGKHQGNTLVLGEGSYTTGRGLDVDLTLDDETMSRRHARFVVSGDKLRIEDLGSTNGTFVNGVQVTGAVLKPGDAIVVGACLVHYKGLRAHGDAASPSAVARASGPRPSLYDRASADRKTAPEALAGNLAAFHFSSLAQLVAASSATGRLELDHPKRRAEIYLRAGRVVAAEFADDPTPDAEKVFYRVLRWNVGDFVLSPNVEYEGDRPTVSLDVNMLLLEGTRVLDELNALGKQPALSDMLYVPEPIEPLLSELSTAQLDTLQLVHNHHRVETVLDRSRTSDLDTMRDIVHLLARGYVVARA